jgi:F-type H+-transporting ATPase subunit c
LAQGKAIAACAEAMARNPGAAGNIKFALILGLALIESLALYTLVIVFAKLS